MLTIDYAGEIIELESDEGPFVMGRDGDLVIDDNPYLHRRFLEITHQGGVWLLTNVGSQISATVNDPSSSVHAWLAPGGQVPIVHGETKISFSAGPTSYEVILMLDAPPEATGSPDAVVDGTATIGRVELTHDQKLMLVVLAESALRNGMGGLGDIPSAAAAAARIGWTRTRFEKKIDNVCDRLSNAGVRGLKGDLGNQAVSRRVRLVEYAVTTRLVSPDDLEMLDDAAAGGSDS